MLLQAAIGGISSRVTYWKTLELNSKPFTSCFRGVQVSLSNFAPRDREGCFCGISSVASDFHPCLFPRQKCCVTVKAMDDARTAVQRLVNADEKGGWDKAWQEGTTPWDLKGVHPAIRSLLDSQALPEGRVLVPGSGSAWDAMAMAGPSRHVVALDLSPTAIDRARELANGKPEASYMEFVAGDFFTFSPSEPFDLILDYTFFCAIPPRLRPHWGQKMAELLSPKGELLTIMFPLGEYEGGPPYAVAEQAYKDVLKPHGLELATIEPILNSVGPRAGKEKLGRWRFSASAKI